MNTLHIICEVLIFALGATAIYLLSRNDKYSKWGMVIGLLSEPFWFISAYISGSWGILAVSFAYTIMYINGIRNWFKKKNN